MGVAGRASLSPSLAPSGTALTVQNAPRRKQALENTLNHLMNCITDSDLPVRIQAAIALPELVRYERVRERMLPNLGRIMQGACAALAPISACCCAAFAPRAMR